MKIIVMIFLLVLISACSLNTRSGFWNEKKVNTLTLDNLDTDLTYDEYKTIIIEYGKKSKFPEINVN